MKNPKPGTVPTAWRGSIRRSQQERRQFSKQWSASLKAFARRTH